MRQNINSIIRILVFWAAFWLLLIGMRAVPPSIFHDWTMIIIGSLLAGLSLGMVFLLLKVDNQKLDGVGINLSFESFIHFALGTLIGIVVVGVMLIVITTITPVDVQRVANPNVMNAVAYASLVLFVLALMEEIVFRSYPLFRLSESIGVRASIYITSIIFAFYHGLSPTNLLGPGVWGLFFGLAAIWTKSIALPLGFHFGLNWAQSLFGMKLKYATSIWILVPGDKGGLFDTEVVGWFLQIVLLILGLTLIEIFVRKDRTI